MCNLVLFLYQIKFLCNTRIVFESVFADGEKFLNRVLDSSLNLTFVENHAESLKDSIDSCWSCF